MSGLHFMGEAPYTHVYLHGTVRDTQHRKMSKSLGNGIDPLEVVERYGADALRYTLVSGMSVGTDVILDPDDLEESFAPGRNFANKLWNAGRFILSNLDGPPRPLAGVARARCGADELTLADRWIIARCDATVREATEAYEKFRLNEAAAAVYRFLWSDLADWYIEQIKPRLYGDVPGGDVARAVADADVRRRAPPAPPGDAVRDRSALAPVPRASATRPRSRWRPGPCPTPGPRMPRALAEFGAGAAGRGRHPRHPRRVRRPAGPDRARVRQPRTAAARRAAIERERGTIVRLAKLSELSLGESAERVGGHAVLPDGTAVFVPLGDAIDVGRECGRLGAEAERLAAARGLAGEEAGQPAVRLAGARRRGRARAREARRLDRAAARCWSGSGSCWGAGDGLEPAKTAEMTGSARPAAARFVALVVAAFAVSCARMEPPPGGPPDIAPPQLVATRPDSLASIPNFKGDVEFQFDEVISEGGSPNQGAGTGDLEKLVILSPDDARARRELATEQDHRPSGGGLAAEPGLPGRAAARRGRSPAQPEQARHRAHVHDRGPPPDDHDRGHRGRLDLQPPELRGAGGGVAASRQPVVPRAGGFERPLFPGPASRRRVSGEGRDRPEPQQRVRRSRSLRHRASRQGQDSGRRALGLRPRHDAAANPGGRAGRQRVGHDRPEPDARPASAARARAP